MNKHPAVCFCIKVSVLTVGCIVLTGCRFAARERKPTAAIHSQSDVAVTQEQIRLRMRALVGPMCGEIEQAADQIIAATADPSIRKAALLWKIEGVPALREALFQPVPLTALVDTWVLCNQLVDYFESGPGRQALGDSAPVAVAACRRMEEEVAAVAASMSISGNVSKAREFGRKWAADHPIRHSIASRESALSRVLERDALGSLSAGEAVMEVTTAVDDLNRRLEVYTHQLVRQARWEADLFKTELLGDLPLDHAMVLAERAVKSAEQAATTVERFQPTVERAVGIAESAPDIIDAERKAAIKAFQEEVSRTIKFVQEERIASLEHLTKERLAAMKDLQTAVLADGLALSAEVERIGQKALDYTIWRLVQLIAACLVVWFVGAALLLFLSRRLFAPRTS